MIFLEEMKESERGIIEKLYEESFPKEERKPFSLLIKLRKKKKASLLVIHDQEKECPIGLAFMLLGQDKVLCDYLAVMPKFQSMGYGTNVLSVLRDRYLGKCILGEVEPLDINALNYKQRVRRMKFYLQNGVKEAGILIYFYGCELQVMYLGDCKITFEEYMKFQESIVGFWGKRKLKKNIKLLRTYTPVETVSCSLE